MLDLFLTHAWRYHDDWQKMVSLLNTRGVRNWRNFSLPWYDPALDARTEDGGRIVRWQLETQIIPCHAVLLLSGVYEIPASRKWVDFEIDIARKHAKPVIAVPAWGQNSVPERVRELADIMVDWDADAIVLAATEARERAAGRVAP
jgi:MTH538 TIR-like domain (DUF1863)